MQEGKRTERHRRAARGDEHQPPAGSGVVVDEGARESDVLVEVLGRRVGAKVVVLGEIVGVRHRRRRGYAVHHRAGCLGLQDGREVEHETETWG